MHVQVSEVNSTSSLCKIFLIAGQWSGSEVEIPKKGTSCSGFNAMVLSGLNICHNDGTWKLVWHKSVPAAEGSVWGSAAGEA